jgi:cyclohexadieny/prephenate dehydrogenase
VNVDTLTIVGVGLIGGSIGLAAKRHGLARQVLGVGRHESSLDRARQCGSIDEGYTDAAPAAARSQLIILCTPVDGIADQALGLAQHCAPGTILSDAGSTKAAIVHAVDGRLPSGVAFVGAHPLAGSEKRGPEHARADLFQGRCTVLTPTERTDAGALERVGSFWHALGARVTLMSPEEHDRALAVTSHLPHLVASALAGILPEQLHDLAATGFRSTTRVAAGDPALWTGIFMHNRQAVLEALALLEERLTRFRHALTEADRTALDQLLAQGKKVRDALGN